MLTVVFQHWKIHPKRLSKFYKVMYGHYSGEVGNVYVTLWQIYSGPYVANFIRIVQAL